MVFRFAKGYGCGVLGLHLNIEMMLTLDVFQKTKIGLGWVMMFSITFNNAVI